ncbi:hypothetical protein SPB21_19045 [Leptothoe sp. ISB3NOV94-8A]
MDPTIYGAPLLAGCIVFEVWYPFTWSPPSGFPSVPWLPSYSERRLSTGKLKSGTLANHFFGGKFLPHKALTLPPKNLKSAIGLTIPQVSTV